MKVLTVDDSKVFQVGMRIVLKAEGVEELYETHTAGEALGVLAGHPDIDVAVVDVSLEAETDGLDLVGQLAKDYPQLKVLVLSHYKNPAYILKAVTMGAKAYIAKDSTPRVIAEAVKQVAEGCCIFFGDTISPKDLRAVFGNDEHILSGKPHGLTPKEINVLELIACGYSNGQIATALGISSHTVESYKDHIKSKLGYNSIIACVSFALTAGMIRFRD